MTETDPLELDIHVAAPPEIVFRYFTDPERYAQWMGTVATLDPVPGGTYHVAIRDGVEVAGTFVEVEPPRRVVFTWGWTDDHPVTPGSTRVEVTLADEPGGTRVRLRHYGLPDEQQQDMHRLGWELYLGRLAVAAGGDDPGPDPHG